MYDILFVLNIVLLYFYLFHIVSKEEYIILRKISLHANIEHCKEQT